MRILLSFVMLAYVMLMSLLWGQNAEPAKAPKAQKVGEKVSKEEVATAKGKDLMDKWKTLYGVAQKLSLEVRNKALDLQTSNIQLRDTQLEMKSVESKLQSHLCDRGKTLVITDNVPACEEAK